MAALSSEERGAHWPRLFWQWDAFALMLGGGLVFAGWILNNEVLKRLFPGFVAMNPVTALGFIMAGAALLCLWLRGRHGRLEEVFGRILAATLTAIGAVKLSGYLFGWKVTFDQILFRAELTRSVKGFSNEIAPNTALNFVLGGCALWFLNSSGPRFSRKAQNFSLALGLASLFPLVGYLYQASYLYGVGAYTPMALHTALFFLLLAYGALLAQAEYGIVALFLSATPGGATARRLLPVAFVAPIALGALQFWGAKSGHCPSELGVTLLVVACVGVFATLTWRTAVLLNRSHELRRRAEQNLQKAHDDLEDQVRERTVQLYKTNDALRAHVAELQTAEERIREQAELLNKANDAILAMDLTGRISFWNKGAELLCRWTADDVVGRKVEEFFFDHPCQWTETLKKLTQSAALSEEAQRVTKDGRTVTVASHWTLVHNAQGRPKSLLLIDTDITEKKQYEAQMLRSQRMDSLGSLAGGIAHDLNNALAPIIMCAEAIQGELDAEIREKFLGIIISSAHRGSQMVRQILTFARGARNDSAPVQIDSLVREMAKIVRDTFPKAISVALNIEPKETWKVQGDVTELHQVLLNLCVNARDAMPNGGRITLAVDNLRLHGALESGLGAPGSYVLLAVSDTGTGIPPEVLPRIFEPFFTTKAPDKGTGLGLSTVASIVKNRGGFVDINTGPGRGTEFRVYLPAIETSVVVEAKVEEKPLPEGKGELILVMDDEEAVRELTKTMLENYGYRVVTALNGLHGVARFEELKDEIRLIISDSDMPYLSGLAAIGSMQQLKPNIPAILASGAKHDPRELQKLNLSRVAYLEKPFSLKDLLATVAALINPRD
jgi:PAS domain S-box-containing protein